MWAYIPEYSRINFQMRKNVFRLTAILTKLWWKVQILELEQSKLDAHKCMLHDLSTKFKEAHWTITLYNQSNI